MAIYDGTDVFTGNNVTGAKLDSVSMWHGTTLPTSGSNQVPTNGLFFQTDSGLIYENTGTLASPTWTKRSSTGSQFKTFTSSENFSPSKQTGLGLVNVKRISGSGIVKVVVDGTSVANLTSGQTIFNEFVNPSTSLTINAENMDYTVGGTITQTQKSHGNPPYNLTSFIVNEAGTVGYNASNYSTKQFFRYTFGTAYDVSTLNTPSTATTSISIPSMSNQWGMKYVDDGYGIVCAYDESTSVPRVAKTSLSTQWECNTRSSSWKLANLQSDIGSGYATGVDISQDGLKMYVHLKNTADIHEFDLGTAFDVSTFSYVQSQTLDTISSSYTNGDINIRNNGTTLLGFFGNTNASGTGTTLYEWKLNTPYDISSVSNVLFSWTSTGTAFYGYHGFYADLNNPNIAWGDYTNGSSVVKYSGLQDNYSGTTYAEIS